MSNLNLSEAAAEILSGSFSAAKAKEDKMGSTGYVPKVSAPQQGEVEIGTAGHKSTDANYDATKGVPTATPPGAKPPVGSEPMKKLSAQPGSKGSVNQPEGSETSDEDKVNRKKATLAATKNPSNPNSVKPYVPEGEDEEEFEGEEENFEEEELEEASIEEVMEDLENMEDELFLEKYGCDKDWAMKQMSGDDEEDEKEEKAAKKAKMKEKVKEDVDAMLSGENLSEEFRAKASMIFEAAVEARVEEIASELEEQFTREFEETLETVKEDFAGKLDSYLDYVVENWMEENKLAIERGLRSEIVEDFIGALKNVFVEHYIDIPEDKTDIVEQLVDKVEELEDEVNEQILKNIDLKKSISEHKKEEAILAVCEGLSLSQVEKIKALAKNIEFVSEEDFSEKVFSIKESYFPNGIITASTESLNDVVEIDEDNTTKVVDPLIEQYAKNLSKLKF